MIWKSTKYIGVGVAWDSNGKVVIVAHYKPAGNIAGYFAENVSVIDPIKHPGYSQKLKKSGLDRPGVHGIDSLSLFQSEVMKFWKLVHHW